MSDIFQEVEEDLRRERLKRVWDRYGIFVIGAALLIVLITAGYRGYDAWQTSRARSNGEAFTAALAAAEATTTTTPANELLAFAADSPQGYAMLARFRAASAFAQAGELEQARDLFRSLSTDGKVPALYQSLASIRLAETLIDLGEIDEAQQSVAAMAEDSSNPFNQSAQELMGLAAYQANDIAAAQRWYTAIRDAVGTPQALSLRARMMLALFEQSTSAADTGGTTGAAEETN